MYGEPLLLSSGQAHAACADACFRRHFPFEPYSPQQCLHISGAAEQDIVFDRIAQKLCVVPQIADICASFCFIEGRKLSTVKPDRSLIRIFAQKRLSEHAFSTRYRSRYSDYLSRSDLEIRVFQHTRYRETGRFHAAWYFLRQILFLRRCAEKVFDASP